MIFEVLIVVVMSIGSFYLGVAFGASHAIKRIGTWMIDNDYKYVLEEFNREFPRR